MSGRVKLVCLVLGGALLFSLLLHKYFPRWTERVGSSSRQQYEWCCGPDTVPDGCWQVLWCCGVTSPELWPTPRTHHYHSCWTGRDSKTGRQHAGWMIEEYSRIKPKRCCPRHIHYQPSMFYAHYDWQRPSSAFWEVNIRSDLPSNIIMIFALDDLHLTKSNRR